MPDLRLRPASPADAELLAATVAEGFQSYRAFAPEGWRAPQALELALGIGVRMRRPAVRAWIAELAGEPAGHVTTLPATESQVGSEDPSLAHLEQLFVRRAHWGSGAATALLAQAVEAARAEGYAAMRLGTPAGQLRARRFYEREGWSVSGEPFLAEPIGLELVEYRRDLR